MLFAEGEIWNNMAQIILAIATLATVFGNIAATIYGHRVNARKIDGVKEDVKDNTDVTRGVSEHVDSKIDSATRDVKAVKEQAERITENAAAKVGVIIGKALSEKAGSVADKVADAAFKNAAIIEKKVDQIAKNVKAEDGTCLTAKVEEHTKQIEQLQSDVKLIKGDTKQIIEMIASRGGGI